MQQLSGMIPTVILEINGVPHRPTAKMLLIYQSKDDLIVCLTQEVVRETTYQTKTLAFDGENFVFPVTPTSVNEKTDTDWKAWEFIQQKPRFLLSNEVEAFCYFTLCMSDVFCAGQARTDFAKVKMSPFWVEVMEEMRTLHPVASVMFQ
jgi:hypothetical protein